MVMLIPIVILILLVLLIVIQGKDVQGKDVRGTAGRPARRGRVAGEAATGGRSEPFGGGPEGSEAKFLNGIAFWYLNRIKYQNKSNG